MRDLLVDLDRWREAGRRAALARVVRVTGSAPRGPGAAMAVDDRWEVAGSVSGGCVEAAVVTRAQECLAGGGPFLLRFGTTDVGTADPSSRDPAAVGVSPGLPDLPDLEVGLRCGGDVEIFVEATDTWETGGGWEVGDGGTPGAILYEDLRDRIERREPVTLETVVAGPGVGAKRLVGGDAGPTGLRREGARSIFVEAFVPAPRLVVVGSVDFSAALVRVARTLGYHVTVCDPRPVFTTARRLPGADDVVVAWPDVVLATLGPELSSRDAVCVMTHDARFDVPALVAALDSDAGYIGALGSRRTQADRWARLREAGVGDRDLARLRAPIGLDIGAASPEETAVAICAEIIADRAGRPEPRSLSHTSGPIH